jgi:hypothetical protein
MKRRATILPPAPADSKPRRKRFLSIPDPDPAIIAADESILTGKSWEAPPAERRSSETETIRPRRKQ